LHSHFSPTSFVGVAYHFFVGTSTRQRSSVRSMRKYQRSGGVSSQQQGVQHGVQQGVQQGAQTVVQVQQGSPAKAGAQDSATSKVKVICQNLFMGHPSVNENPGLGDIRNFGMRPLEYPPNGTRATDLHRSHRDG
jgi:hypothetical protein